MQDPRNLPADTPVHEVMQRLAELSAREAELRRERAILMRETPWYSKPGHWIGLLAIAVSIALSVISLMGQRSRKDLTVSYTESVSLLSSAHGNRSILFDGTPIVDLAKCIVTVRNTGNRAITKEDFPDGPIQLLLSFLPGPQRIDPQGQPMPDVIDVVTASAAGQKKHTLTISNPFRPAQIDYLPSLLNPGEAVELEVYLGTTADVKVKVEGKILDGNVHNAVQQSLEASRLATGTALQMIFRGFHRWLGHKAVAIIVFLIPLIMASVALLFVLSLVTTPLDAEDWAILGFALTFVGLFLSLFAGVVLI